MTCDVCIDGFVMVEWLDAEPDVAVCLCSSGQVLRRLENEGKQTVPLWRVWCARWQFDPARVFMVEDIYSPAELAAVGLVQPEGRAGHASRDAALLAVGRKKVRS